MTFANMPSQDSSKLYKSSFGNLPNETVYSDPMGSRERLGVKVDLKSKEDTQFLHDVQLKSTTTNLGGAGSTDQTLVPLYLDPKIVDISRIQTPVSAMIPRVANQGITAEFNTITAKHFGAGTYDQAFYEESDIGDPGSGVASRSYTPARQSVPIKYMRVVGQVTGPAQASIPGYSLDGIQQSGSEYNSGFSAQQASNAYSFDVITATRSLKEAEEWATLNGSVVANANQFNGITATLGSTNTIAKAGVQITLDDIDEAARLAFEDGGLPEFAVCDTRTYNQIKKALQLAYQGFNFEETGTYGFTYLKFNTMGRTVKIVASRFLSATASNGSLLMLDLSVWEMRVLQDMTMERLAKVDDHERFMVKQYLTLICRAPTFNASITGIGTTAA